MQIEGEGAVDHGQQRLKVGSARSMCLCVFCVFLCGCTLRGLCVFLCVFVCFCTCQSQPPQIYVRAEKTHNFARGAGAVVNGRTMALEMKNS